MHVPPLSHTPLLGRQPVVLADAGRSFDRLAEVRSRPHTAVLPHRHGRLVHADHLRKFGLRVIFIQPLRETKPPDRFDLPTLG